MSKHGQSDTKDLLDTEMNNPEAISSIMALYNVDEARAKEMWMRFIETVKKMKELSVKEEKATK